ncbi:ferredoxin [Pigmentiphaga sp. NML080357]|uniref:2Fe-2S iron-sulfur cluster-binding protein n=1 Tax=Pigmentiphaga sp. NML080357 TaxID=2008675 RepID=UPI000B419059|nr:2Fe-2S iron-sulfur cluster-binding protein [Pigmentiphaga sp. NML080357]OVZ55292.1 ferredoxin [Pigmentiphaga sp. NML080357]
MDADTHEVHILDTGERYRCAPSQTLLAGMEALGRKGIPVGCRGGGCGVCKSRVVRGAYLALKMSRGCVSAEEEAAGVVLACRVMPRGDVELQALDRMRRCVTRHVSRDALEEGRPISTSDE